VNKKIKIQKFKNKNKFKNIMHELGIVEQNIIKITIRKNKI